MSQLPLRRGQETGVGVGGGGGGGEEEKGEGREGQDSKSLYKIE